MSRAISIVLILLVLLLTGTFAKTSVSFGTILGEGVVNPARALDPGTNLMQTAVGGQTGYSKIGAGAQQAYAGFVQSAENMGANARLQERNMAQSVVDAAANHVDAATKDPKKFGELSFNAVTTLATGAQAGMGVYSRATARGTQVAANVEVAVAETAAKTTTELFYIENGVRRSLVSQNAGLSEIPATIFVPGKAPTTTTLRLDQLLSPKPTVPLDSRYLRIQPPIVSPIQVQPLGLPGQLPSVPLKNVILE